MGWTTQYQRFPATIVEFVEHYPDVLQLLGSLSGDTLEVLARNELGENIVATPAIADDKLYVRTVSHLWAFGIEQKKGGECHPRSRYP